MSKGSPSQPWPKLTIGYGADSRCGTVYSTNSSAVGLNASRSSDEWNTSLSGISDKKPRQFALHASGHQETTNGTDYVDLLELD